MRVYVKRFVIGLASVVILVVALTFGAYKYVQSKILIVNNSTKYSLEMNGINGYINFFQMATNYGAFKRRGVVESIIIDKQVIVQNKTISSIIVETSDEMQPDGIFKSSFASDAKIVGAYRFFTEGNTGHLKIFVDTNMLDSKNNGNNSSVQMANLALLRAVYEITHTNVSSLDTSTSKELQKFMAKNPGNYYLLMKLK